MKSGNKDRKTPSTIRIEGRILYLTRDLLLLRRQLKGEDLDWNPSIMLVDNVSTDELTPGWVCYYYDRTLGDYCLVGLRGGVVGKGDIKKGGFEVIVSGISKGCGSSRETAPFSELAAGMKIVVAKSFEKIYGQNSQNIGLLTTTDFSLLDEIREGKEIGMEWFTEGLDPVSADIVRYGGLFAYNRARMAGQVGPPPIQTPERAMTIVEKIIASHAVVDAETGELGIEAVKPGDALFVRTDVRFSHEYVTPMAENLFRTGLGENAKVKDPESVFAFRDHLTFLDRVMPEDHVKMGLRDQAASLKTVQEDFARRHGIRLFGEVQRDGEAVGSEAICHNKVIEKLANPGQLVLGTDSHTCMAGVLGCFAFGVGSTDMANAWYTKDVRVRVPETVRIVLEGSLPIGCTAKDVMLMLLAMDFFRSGKGIGKVLEFSGSAVREMGVDERSTLTNMAVEAGSFTGIIEADEVILEFLDGRRPGKAEDRRASIIRSDEAARFFETFEIDLSELSPMVATPGDPRNGVAIRDLAERIEVDIAYGGSCTGGKKADMDMYAAVLRKALEDGRRVAEGVRLFIQFGSQEIRDYAVEMGYVECFEGAGAELIDPSCGACIKAGPGVSESADQVTVSAINRNFPGRSGPGKVYLASPYTVAASAVAGYIVSPEAILEAVPS